LLCSAVGLSASFSLSTCIYEAGPESVASGFNAQSLENGTEWKRGPSLDPFPPRQAGREVRGRHYVGSGWSKIGHELWFFEVFRVPLNDY